MTPILLYPFLLRFLFLPCLGKKPSYTYLWSFLFKSYATAQNTFLFHNWVLGFIAPLAVTIMSFFPGTVNDVARGLTYLLSICPQYALGQGLFNLGFRELFGWVDDTSYEAFDMRITGESLLYMGIFSVFYFVLLLVVERWVGCAHEIERGGGVQLDTIVGEMIQ